MLARFIAGMRKEHLFPLPKAASQSCDLGDGTGVEDSQDLGRNFLAVTRVVDLVGGPQVVDLLPGDERFLVGRVSIGGFAGPAPLGRLHVLNNKT